MARPVISLGYLRKRKVERTQEFRDGLKEGMTADEVVAFSRKKLVKYTRGPEKIAEDGSGYVVEWYYPGVILTLKRVESPGPYVVVNVEMGEVVN